MAQTQLKSKLIAEGTIPAYLPKAIEDGKKEFESLKTSEYQSRVHTYSDVYAQAVIVGAVSKNKKEGRSQSLCTFGADYIDDFFDQSDSIISVEEMIKYRTNVQKLFSHHPKLKNMCDHMIKGTKNSEGFWKGMTRMLYGGLIQRTTGNQQKKFLRELHELGMKNVSKEVIFDVKNIRDVMYSLTTKGIMDLVNSPCEDSNATLEELYSLAYSPAVYLHDSDEEEKQGEQNFNGQIKPKTYEMVQMIDIATKHIRNYENRPKERLRQLKILRKTFKKVLPKDISQAYERLEKELENISDSKGQSHGLEDKLLRIIGISSFIFSLVFFSSNITGNVISNISQPNSNILGIVLFVLGIFLLFFSTRKKTIYFKQNFKYISAKPTNYSKD